MADDANQSPPDAATDKDAPIPGPKTAEAAADLAAAPTATTTAAGALNSLPRVVSLFVLLAVVLLIGVLFFRVMASFLVPLFLAAVMTVVFKPLHNWMLSRLDKRKQLAALATTAAITLLVLGPTALLGWMAYIETARIVRVALVDSDESPAEFGGTAQAPEPIEAPGPFLSADLIGVESAEAEAAGWSDYVRGHLEPLADWYQVNVNGEFDPAKLAEYAARNAVRFGLVGVQTLVGFLLGLAIMIFAMYYFFADGPTIIETLMHLSPLDDDYERELLQKFSNVSRAVVLATVLSAIVQGLLAGVGYVFVLDSWAPPAVAAQYDSLAEIPEAEKLQPPFFLLTVLTMLLAIVPFVGATAVWIPVAVWVFYAQGSSGGAIGLAVYGALVVSSIDNVIKPYVLHGQSNLHPLLALLSVLGGIQLLGPIGILVGPMLVAFLQALLEMLRKELDGIRAESGNLSGNPAAGPAASEPATA